MTKSGSFWRLISVGLALTAAAFGQLPEPPQQREPWSLPATQAVPDFVLKAVPLVFDAGLADPRGGEYREIEIDSQGAPSPIRTHCWVFNGSFAVCWDGLVYRISSAGAAANLEEDVRALAAAGPWNGRGLLTSAPPTTFWSPLRGQDRLAPVAMLLLMRLNRPDLAAILWQTPETPNVFNFPQIKLPQSHESSLPQFVESAVEAWLGRAMDLLAAAYEGGDDRSAIDLARSLLDWQPRAMATLPYVFGFSRSLNFLDVVPTLLADSQRRLRESPRASLNLDALDKNDPRDPSVAAFLARPQPARVAELIDRLEDAQGSKIGWPGPMLFSFDPLYRQLLKEGLPAVDALLDAYENDTRLNRTLDYSRPWIVARTPIPVRNVVKSVLSDILNLPELFDQSTPAQFRSWWSQHKSRTPLDLSFELLNEDTATAEQWVASAKLITLRSDIEPAGSTSTTLPGGCKPGSPAPPPHGEVLRARQNPSVQDLLIKRTRQLAAESPASSCRIAFASFLWDPATSGPALNTAAALEACHRDSNLAAARISIGDSAAAGQWASLIRGEANKPSFFTIGLAPFWMFPDNPDLKRALEDLVSTPQSALSPHHDFMRVHSPLLALPDYRKAVLDALNDSSLYGSATRSSDGALSVRAGNAGYGGLPNDRLEPDPRNVPPGEQRPVRVKDMVAWQLGGLDGVPAFQPDWPISDKDSAAAQIATFLTERGGDLRGFPAKAEDAACQPESVYLAK